MSVAAVVPGTTMGMPTGLANARDPRDGIDYIEVKGMSKGVSR